MLDESSSMLAQITEGVRRVDSILEQKGLPEPASPKIPENYSIDFQNVDFAYDENQVLHDVSFKIDEVKFLHWLGHQIGKTTIANLTARLWI